MQVFVCFQAPIACFLLLLGDGLLSKTMSLTLFHWTLDLILEYNNNFHKFAKYRRDHIEMIF